MLRWPLLALWALGLCVALDGADVERIHRVRVEGSAPEVKLETKPGSPLRTAVVRRDVQRLWALDRFSDVRVRREATPAGPDIVFEVEPRPRYVLRQFRFEPASEKRSLEGEPPPWVDEATAQGMARELAAGLRQKGFLQAKVRGTLARISHHVASESAREGCQSEARAVQRAQAYLTVRRARGTSATTEWRAYRALAPSGGEKCGLDPVNAAHADVVLSVEPGERLRVKDVEVAGVDRKQARKLRRSATELTPRAYIPGLLRLSRAFTAERLGRDVRSLHAALVAEGRLAAKIHADVERTEEANRVRVRLLVSPGPRFQVTRADLEGLSNVALAVAPEQFPADALCDELRAARRESEAQGRLGFSATIEAQSQGAVSNSGAHAVQLSVQTETGPPTAVGRIDFSGETSLRDSSLRRALKLEEGGVLDAGRLRRDLTRLSRFEALKPVTMDNVEIRPAGDGLADLLIRLEGRKSRRWSISGPLGPANLFGPFQALVETRLPTWGRGVLEASTYAVGFWLSGLPEAVATTEGWAWKTIYRPTFVLRRTSLPAQAWTSGWLWSPQLSRSANVSSNVVGRSRSLLSKAVASETGDLPLVVPIAGEGVDGELVCREPWSWTDPLRGLARLLIGI